MFHFATTLVSVALVTSLSGCSQPARPLPVSPPAFEVAAPPSPAELAAGSIRVGRPTRLLVPTIGVDERLVPVGLQSDGAMETPDFGGAGWYAPGPRPGASGPAVIVAHVHGPAGDDVFARLHELRPGDEVTVERTDGSTTFVVTDVTSAPKEELPYDRIWADSPVPLLRLITCGGAPDPVSRTYPDNTIVYARTAD